MTESWLKPEICKTRTHLDGYEQFRNDWTLEDSRKSKGGGILVYVDRKWSTNNRIIYNYTDEDCEILSVKSRPHWLPRDFTSIISISCYARFTGTSCNKSTTDCTVKQISSHVKKMELEHPDSCILVMGDFNQLPIKLNGYYQTVTKPTRGKKTLDKCFIRIKKLIQILPPACTT